MHLPVKPLNEIAEFVIKLGKHCYYFCSNETPFNDSSSAKITNNKYCTNSLLNMAGIPVPKAVLIHKSEFQEGSYEQKTAALKFPLVIKPLDSSYGLDVLCNIQTPEELNFFLTRHFTSYQYAQIEEFHGKLKSYRILVFNRKILGIVLRNPASIIGDGQHNIKELIELTNIERNKINVHLGPILIDDECQIKLKEQGINSDYIPSAGEHVVLAYTSNSTRGGAHESLRNRICKENRKLMIRATEVLNLNLAGIDVECADINRPLTESNGVIIEVNHRPNIRIHELPLNGKPNLVTKKIMRSFIYRHPFAYLYSLYSNKPTALYIKAIFILCIMGVIYSLLGDAG